MWVDIERAPIDLIGLLALPHHLQKLAKPRERMEMPRLIGEGLADIPHRAFLVLQQEMHDGAAMIGLRPIGFQRHHEIKKIEREVEVFRFGRLLRALEQEISRIRAGFLESLFDLLGDGLGGIRRRGGLEPLEKAINPLALAEARGRRFGRIGLRQNGRAG